MQNRNDHINIEIMENELKASDWGMNNLAWELYWWWVFLTSYFSKVNLYRYLHWRLSAHG